MQRSVRHRQAFIHRSAINYKKLLKSSLLLLTIAIVVSGLTLLPGPVVRIGLAEQPNKLSTEATQQIQALLAEKESRTPAQRRIDSQLVYAIKARRGEFLLAALPAMKTGIAVDPSGKTVVDIVAKIDESLIEDLKAAGAELSEVYPQYNSLRANVRLDRLEAIAGLPQVIFIQPKQEGGGAGAADQNDNTASQPLLSVDFTERAGRVQAALLDALGSQKQHPNAPSVGSVNSQGDTAHKASNARAAFGANGAGVRIGVMSDGVNTLATSQGTGDLGAVTILAGQGGNGNEGTAMLEIVHDIAPGAELYFASSASSPASMAQNIRDLRAAGCDIIIDDWTFFVESPFHNGQGPSVVSTNNAALVVEAVNDVTAAGCLYFSDAANAGSLKKGTSGTFEGDFVSGGALALTPGGNVHDFDPGAGVSQFDAISLPGSGATNPPIALHWADPLGASSNDYDLFVLNSAGTVVLGASTNIQSGTQDPIEILQAAGLNVVGNRIVVLQKTGAADRFLHLNLYRGRLTFNTTGETRGHNAIGGNSNHFCVAASNAGAGAPYTTANPVENFSSDGPRRIFFNSDGSAITPGNFSSTGGTVLQKPDITAADGVSTTAPGFTTFFGTSAAAPHAGAIAGLLKSAFPNMTPAQIRTTMVNTAIDIEGAGVENNSGAGIVMAFEALQSAGAVASANFELVSAVATETCCNSNGFIEPGESANLNVQLKNSGVANGAGISATLTTSTPGVTITNGTSAYPDTASPAGTNSNTAPFQFHLSPNFICDTTIDFTLTISYTGGNSPKVVRFAVPLTVRQAITTTLDATQPTTSTDFPVSATGTQTGRLNRFTPNGSCSNVEACPGLAFTTGDRQFDSYTFTNPTAFATCASVTYTSPCSGGLFAAAYTNSFDPADICANYLSDAGSSPVANTPGGFSFNVPAGGTVVVVIHEVNVGGGVGCSYTLQVAGICKTAPTAAPADISGKVVNAAGSPLAGVVMSLSGSTAATTTTDNAGNYIFANVGTGNFYTVTPALANYHFAPGNRSFSVVGNQTEAVFTASADEVATANAIDSNEFFVRQHYLDFLGREPDPDGLAYWAGKLNQCNGEAGCLRTGRIDVSAAFFLSDEFGKTGGYIYRLYEAGLGRQLSYGEFAADRTQVVGGANLDQARSAFVEVFVNRAEFAQKYQGQTTGAAFVDALLETLRASAGVDLASERTNLLNRYQAGGTMNEGRALVLREVGESASFANAAYNRSFVLMEYFGYLRRGAEQQGNDFWVQVLNNNGGDYRGMVCSFLTSMEYQRRFGTVVTRSDMECASER